MTQGGRPRGFEQGRHKRTYGEKQNPLACNSKLKNSKPALPGRENGLQATRTARRPPIGTPTDQTHCGLCWVPFSMLNLLQNNTGATWARRAGKGAPASLVFGGSSHQRIRAAGKTEKLRYENSLEEKTGGSKMTALLFITSILRRAHTQVCTQNVVRQSYLEKHLLARKIRQH